MAAYEALQAFSEAYRPEAPVAPEPQSAPVATRCPRRWEDIAVGSLVLASVGIGEGWYEAVVAEDRGEALFVLQWRDWPDDSPFLRRADGRALLPATPVVEVAAGE